MSSRFDVARYHKPLSVCIFGGGTVLLLLGAIYAAMSGNTWTAVGLGLAFVLLGVPVAFFFLDMFVWEPRRTGTVQSKRLESFLTTQRHRADRVRQRERGLRG
jgi:hypothetical protein